MNLDDDREELTTLTAALRAHLEWQARTGATGLPRATAELASERRSAAVDSGAPRQVTSAAAAPAEGSDADRKSTASTASGEAAIRARAPLEKDRSDATRRLEVLADTVRGCTRCVLHEARTQTVFSRGSGSSGLCFVGEGPGADEDAQGEPFVGKAGQLLDRMIAAMGFERDEVYVCNVVKCRPPQNRKPEPAEMAACRSYLEEQLELVSPQVIVALGATALEGLLGITGGITRLRGNWRLYRGRTPVMPTFHPAYLLRTPAAKRDVWNDLQQVLEHMGRPVPERPR